jgi:hypothetical protein
MVRISDDAFMMPEPHDVRPERLSPRQRELLRGIGDRSARAAEDFLADLGVDLRGVGAPELPEWKPVVGERAEWVTPDGIQRSGEIHEVGRDVVVKVNDGEFVMVPKHAVREPKRSRADRVRNAIRASIAGGGGFGTLEETGDLLPINASGKDYKMTLQYGHVKPTDQDVMVYTAAKYPGAHVLDADDTHPGRLGVIVHFPEGRTAVTLPQVSPSQFMDPMMSEDKPNNELLRGTGLIGSPAVDSAPRRADSDGDECEVEVDVEIEKVEAAFKRLASCNPGVDLVETAFEQTDGGVHLAFHTTHAVPLHAFIETRQGRLRGGILTDQGVAKFETFGIKTALHPPYSMGSGPLNVREDEKGGFEDGDYAVKADLDVDAGPLTQRDMSQMVRPGDPGFTPAEQEQEMAERKNRERRLRERRQRMQQQQQQPAETGTMPGLMTGPSQFEQAGDIQSEEDGEVREHLGGPGLQVANKAAVLRRMAQMGVQKGDRFTVIDDIADDDSKPVPAGATITVKETDVGQFGDAILTDGTDDYVFEPKTLEQLYMDDKIDYATSSESPEDKARAAGRAAFERGFKQATKIHELAEYEFPNDSQSQQAFIDGYMEAAREGHAHQLVSQKLAADKKTKDYYRGLFSGSSYGKMLTSPVRRKKHKAEDGDEDEAETTKEAQRQLVNTMRYCWRHYGLGEPSAQQIFKVSYVIREGRRHFTKKAITGLFGGEDPIISGFGTKSSPGRAAPGQGAAAQPGGAAGAQGGFADMLITMSQFNPAWREHIDKMVVDAIAKEPGVLSKMSPDAYKGLVQTGIDHLQNTNPKALQQMQDAITGALGGQQKQPGFMQKVKDWWSKEPEPSPGPMTHEGPTMMGPADQPAAPSPAAPAPGPQAPSPAAPSPAAPAAPEESYEIDLGEYGFSPAEVESDMPPAAQTPEKAPAQAPGAAPPKRKRRKKETFTPQAGMQIMNARGDPVAEAPSGHVIKKWDDGTVRWRGGDGQIYQTAPRSAAVPELPASPAPQPGLRERGKEVGKKLLRRLTSEQQKQADASSDAYAGRRPPAKNQLRFKLDRLVKRGDYLVATVVWDPSDCQDMGPANIRHNVVSFIKQKATEKEFIDLGTISKPRLNMCDTDAGIAEVIFRSSEARSFVPELAKGEGEFYEPIA